MLKSSNFNSVDYSASGHCNKWHGYNISETSQNVC